MRTLLKPLLIVAVIVLTSIGWVCHAQNSPAAAKHEPNGGYVSDAGAAKDIAKVVMRQLLTPDDFKRKEFSDAVLKDGIWTVRYWEPKARINFPVVIQIRQQTGSVVSYADPNA